MRSMVGNEEAKLVLALMHKKAEVPEDLKAKALEQLRVFSMSCEAGSAKGYLLDKLIEAIETNDVNKVIEVSEMAAGIMNDFDCDGDEATMDPELEEMARDAIDSVIGMLEGEGLAEKEAASLLKRVMDSFSFIPLIIADGMMIGWSGEYGRIVVFGMNFEGDKGELAEKYNGIDGKQRMLSVLHRQFNLGEEVKVGFAVLKYKKLDDNNIELLVRSL